MSHQSAVTFDTVWFNSLCLLCFVFSFISLFVLFSLLFSVSNFYFTSQYTSFLPPSLLLPPYHPSSSASSRKIRLYSSCSAATAATAAPTTAAAATTIPAFAATTAAIALKFHSKHEKRKQKP